MALKVLTDTVTFSAVMQKDGKTERVAPEEVKQREIDGWLLLEPSISLVVSEESWAVGSKLNRLEREAFERWSPKLDSREITAEEFYFRVRMYPRLLAATVAGTPPLEEEALEMPSRELDKWYLPVLKLNPEWFGTSPDAKQDQTPAQAEAEKKKDG